MAFRNSISHEICFDRISGATALSEKDLSVEQCMRLIIMTSKGELLGDPNFGSNIVTYLGMSNTNIIAELVINDLLSAITTYEKRVSITREDISFKIDNDYMYITINYILLQTGESETFELTMSRRNYNVE